MHILIIEDEIALCQSIAEGLRMDGYEIDTCFDGNEGLDLCTCQLLPTLKGSGLAKGSVTR